MSLLAVLSLLSAGAVAASDSPASRIAAEPPIDAAAFNAAAASATSYTENVRARLLAEQGGVAPGGSVALALVLDIRPHWHTYWRNPGDSGEPPRITWQLPEGVGASEIRWPLPERIPVGPLVNYGYSDRAVHLVRLTLPPDWPVGEPLNVAAEATWLVCEEECVPEQGSFALTLDTRGASDGAPPAAVQALFDQARARLPSSGVIAADLRRHDGVLQLRLPAAAVPGDLRRAYFFPDRWGLVNHAAEQSWSIEDNALVLELQPGDAVSSTAARGLLKVEASQGVVGLLLDATPATTASAGEAPVGRTGGDAIGLPLALGFALLGGLILNLMPCVFPVLAIKALGLASQSGAGFRHRLLHGLAYTAGVLAFFLGLGALLLGLRSAGAAVGWGFQLQSPLFVTLMGYLFVVLGLSLAGAITLGAGLMGVGQGGVAGDTRGESNAHLAAFATGGLAALVAAPCTAPFMGAALGYAMTVPWPVALSIMLMLGVGMALPLLLLSLSPRLARALPRPGAWMETLKQALAFPMFATAAWLFWVLTVQTGAAGLAAAMSGTLLLALGLWLHEQVRLARTPWPRVGQAAGVLGIAAALWLAVDAPPLGGDTLAQSTRSPGAEAASTADGLVATPYSARALSDARAAGQPVFVNMTAAWCITCLVNERVALSRPAVASAFRERDLLYLKGDWTNRDPAITDYLAGFGRNGVPIYVFYPSAGEPRVLPQILTEGIVLEQIGAG